MVSSEVAKKTLFVVVILIACATSHPYKRSSHSASRHNSFEWNARRIGTKKVATISIRKDEERDRRSIPLGDDDDESVISGSSGVSLPALHHHHSGHDSSRGSHRPHRHHHGDEVDGGGALDKSDVEWLPESDGGDGEIPAWEAGQSVDRSRRRLDLSDAQPNEIMKMMEMMMALEEEEKADEDLEGDDEGGGEMGFPGVGFLQEMVPSAELIDLDDDLFKNVSLRLDRGHRKSSEVKSPKRKKKKKKRSKKVKRDRRRRRNKGKRRRGKGKKKNSRNRRKCRHLKGKEKKKCRAEVARSEATQVEEEDIFSVSLSGDDACQYHHLEECSHKVGFLRRNPDKLRTVVKCRYREEFFDCIEELRLEACDENFETRGNMKALRKRIRDAIYTTNSCIISEVIEG